jgi:transposase-like protein
LTPMLFKTNKTPTKRIHYALPQYFSGLSLRKVSQQYLSPFIKRNNVSIWNWIPHYKPEKKKLHRKRRRKYEFVVDDETLIKVGNELVRVWIATELKSKIMLGIRLSYESSTVIADHFIRSLVRRPREDRHASVYLCSKKV